MLKSCIHIRGAKSRNYESREMNLLAKKLARFTLIVTVNIVLCLLLFALAELLYRIRCDGLRGAFINIFSAVPYSNLGTHNWVISDPVLGYRLNPTREGINSLGIKGKEVILPKPASLFRLVFLGDSVPWANPGFVSYTSEALLKERNIEVINAAIPGYGTYQELMFLKSYLLQASPDLVVLCYCLNDNHTFLHRFDEKGHMLFTRDAADSLEVNSFWDEIISRSYLLSRIKLGLIVRQQHKTKSKFPWESRVDIGIAWEDRPWIKFDEYLVEMNAVLRNKGSEFAVVILPCKLQLNEAYLKAGYNYVIKPQTVLKRLCDKRDVPCLDLFQSFYDRQKQGIKLYKDDIHFNESGHRVAAEEILRFLHERALLTH